MPIIPSGSATTDIDNSAALVIKETNRLEEFIEGAIDVNVELNAGQIKTLRGVIAEIKDFNFSSNFNLEFWYNSDADPVVPNSRQGLVNNSSWVNQPPNTDIYWAVLLLKDTNTINSVDNITYSPPSSRFQILGSSFSVGGQGLTPEQTQDIESNKQSLSTINSRFTNYDDSVGTIEERFDSIVSTGAGAIPQSIADKISANETRSEENESKLVNSSKDADYHRWLNTSDFKLFFSTSVFTASNYIDLSNRFESATVVEIVLRTLTGTDLGNVRAHVYVLGDLASEPSFSYAEQPDKSGNHWQLFPTNDTEYDYYIWGQSGSQVSVTIPSTVSFSRSVVEKSTVIRGDVITNDHLGDTPLGQIDDAISRLINYQGLSLFDTISHILNIIHTLQAQKRITEEQIHKLGLLRLLNEYNFTEIEARTKVQLGIPNLEQFNAASSTFIPSGNNELYVAISPNTDIWIEWGNGDRVSIRDFNLVASRGDLFVYRILRSSIPVTTTATILTRSLQDTTLQSLKDIQNNLDKINNFGNKIDNNVGAINNIESKIQDVSRSISEDASYQNSALSTAREIQITSNKDLSEIGLDNLIYGHFTRRTDNTFVSFGATEYIKFNGNNLEMLIDTPSSEAQPVTKYATNSAGRGHIDDPLRFPYGDIDHAASATESLTLNLPTESEDVILHINSVVNGNGTLRTLTVPHNTNRDTSASIPIIQDNGFSQQVNISAFYDTAGDLVIEAERTGGFDNLGLNGGHAEIYATWVDVDGIPAVSGGQHYETVATGLGRTNLGLIFHAYQDADDGFIVDINIDGQYSRVVVGATEPDDYTARAIETESNDFSKGDVTFTGAKTEFDADDFEVLYQHINDDYLGLLDLVNETHKVMRLDAVFEGIDRKTGDVIELSSSNSGSSGPAGPKGDKGESGGISSSKLKSVSDRTYTLALDKLCCVTFSVHAIGVTASTIYNSVTFDPNGVPSLSSVNPDNHLGGQIISNDTQNPAVNDNSRVAGIKTWRISNTASNFVIISNPHFSTDGTITITGVYQ